MSNTNPALHPLYLAIGAISGRALFRGWLKGTTPYLYKGVQLNVILPGMPLNLETE